MEDLKKRLIKEISQSASSLSDDFLALGFKAQIPLKKLESWLGANIRILLAEEEEEEPKQEPTFESLSVFVPVMKSHKPTSRFDAVTFPSSPQNLPVLVSSLSSKYSRGEPFIWVTKLRKGNVVLAAARDFSDLSDISDFLSKISWELFRASVSTEAGNVYESVEEACGHFEGVDVSDLKAYAAKGTVGSLATQNPRWMHDSFYMITLKESSSLGCLTILGPDKFSCYVQGFNRLIAFVEVG